MFDFISTPQRTTPSRLAFTGNPIIMRSNDHFGDQPVGGYPFKIEIEGVTVFNGRFNYPHFINVADIVNAYAQPILETGDVEPIDNGPFILIEDESEVSCRQVWVVFDGEFDEEMAFFALPGGISKQNFRRLGGPFSSRDIFTERFCAAGTNCFLTTRTAGWRILMKETEIYPLYCISDYGGDWFQFVEKTTGQSWEVEDMDRGIYALDVEALRRHFFDEFGVLANSFDIYHRNKYACRLVIEQADPARERYRLKFRNSLGVFEIIEITGEMSITPQWEDAEDKIFKKYDWITDDYISARDRIERKQKITVKTGIKRPDETRFLMDMLGSDEVYLLDLTGLPVRVIPSAEEFVYKQRPEAPQSFTLTLELADSETNILQEIIDGSEARKPRVFSKQFSKQFN